ncbi:hypothetical protein M5M_09643 [Simiduia agarivorans SA1 = DSM 21679]|uniref:Uncharacterized protein n=1 Tax=Simiduia agarivorans (strain DSM 21679 / JCM 13881 / BCRC 17597 / SA1) TaxID=1117647 RepID=R9S3C1_SIMAS|nr:hypothetical protein M5M_09643 [Simiduia agarivorans SA1 = DSM 21679]
MHGVRATYHARASDEYVCIAALKLAAKAAFVIT